MKRRATKNLRPKPEKWILRLYLADQTPRSLAALSNLKQFCENHLTGHYQIELTDLLKQPEMAKEHQILAIPTLVRRLPEPMRKIIGDLSNEDSVLVGLEILPNKPQRAS